MALATLTVNKVTVSFLIVQFPDGFPAFANSINEEELTTPGVDGRRWRTVFEQLERFAMVTTTEAPSPGAYSDAVTLATTFRTFVGRLGLLSLTIAGQTYTIKDVHILAVKPTPRPGKVVGAGAAGTGTGFLEAEWQIVLTAEQT